MCYSRFLDCLGAVISLELNEVSWLKIGFPVGFFPFSDLHVRFGSRGCLLILLLLVSLALLVSATSPGSVVEGVSF